MWSIDKIEKDVSNIVVINIIFYVMFLVCLGSYVNSPTEHRFLYKTQHYTFFIK